MFTDTRDFDIVGWIIEWRNDGYCKYGCGEHTPEELKQWLPLQIDRIVAVEDEAICEVCGCELSEEEAIDD